MALDRAFEAREPVMTRSVNVQLEGDIRCICVYVAPRRRP